MPALVKPQDKTCEQEQGAQKSRMRKRWHGMPARTGVSQFRTWLMGADFSRSHVRVVRKQIPDG